MQDNNLSTIDHYNVHAYNYGIIHQLSGFCTYITQYGSTVYIGIAMVFVFSPYIREIQFLLSVSSQFDF